MLLLPCLDIIIITDSLCTNIHTVLEHSKTFNVFEEFCDLGFLRLS